MTPAARATSSGVTGASGIVSMLESAVDQPSRMMSHGHEPIMTRRGPVLRLRIVVTDDLERSRRDRLLPPLPRIPHLIVVALWGIAACAVSIILWFALFFEGRAPPRRCSASSTTYIRYSVQVNGYIHIVASPWPRFGGSDGYPIDVELEASARRQSRRTVLPRLFLAPPRRCFLAAGDRRRRVVRRRADGRAPTIPQAAWSVGASAGGLAATAAFLAWFASRRAGGRTAAACATWPRTGSAYTAQVSYRTCSSSPSVYPTHRP